ncbi:hypothetical protein EUGRSUZ_L00316 [Eucalyptus grandis]|uniref:RRM domain-containing protein n=1 Tax=Eucalyptus grandis TaxID=71139 RepID=A0A058ZXT7_EUCGR|nr:hypothetical protein EUGRSUZ_L00316 [Eucalyptus grandis]
MLGVVDKFPERSHGFGFVTFDEKQAMDEAIEAMNGMDLDVRNIIEEKAQPQCSGGDQDVDCSCKCGPDGDSGTQGGSGNDC